MYILFYIILLDFRYREAGAEVINVLSQFSSCVERASIDEAYIDLTNIVDERIRAAKEKGRRCEVSREQLHSTYVVGYQESDVGESVFKIIYVDHLG